MHNFSPPIVLALAAGIAAALAVSRRKARR
jgi:hypothetical protein